MTLAQGAQTGYAFTSRPFGQIGEQADSQYCDKISRTNNDPRAKQIDKVKVDTATNSYTYTFKFQETTISFTADASATVAEVSAGLKAAFDASIVNGYAICTDDGVDEITLTARVGGVGWTISEVDSKMTLTNTTANALADSVAFGLMVVRDVDDTDYARLAKAAALTANVIVLTPSAVNDYLYTVALEFNGVNYFSTYLADASATVKEIVEGLALDINTNMPASTVIATEDDATLTLTSEIAGIDIGLTVGGNLAVTSNNASNLTNINKAALGVSLRDQSIQQDDDGDVYYAAGVSMSIMRQGRIVVTTETEITVSQPVYVRLSGTGTIGGFSGTAGAGLVLLDPHYFSWARKRSSTVAELSVVCQ